MDPDSNTRRGGETPWSISAGILLLGLTDTKPLPNWSPSLMRISQASYSASLPAASSSSSMIVRSEEHTSELQSLMRISYAVFCLKKKKQQIKHNNTMCVLTIIELKTRQYS